MKKIICVHLYNDFSGSPLVLSTAIKGLVKNGYEVTLLTSESEGFLSDLHVDNVNIPYRFHKNKLVRLFRLLLNQWMVFCQILKYRKEENVLIYINTLLPFGAALAGKIIGKKVLYHVHETSINPFILKSFLKWVVSVTANQIIYVSKYLMEKEPIEGPQSIVVHNALSTSFVEKANSNKGQTTAKETPFTVLMLCSLKKYKGVHEYIELAKSLPSYQFNLVLNTDMAGIESYFTLTTLPKNLRLFPKQNDVHPFYQKADLVLNLSNPKEWVETFGMTLLEAMTYGLPVIAPPIGGPTEIVKNGANGFSIAAQKLPKIIKTIKSLAQDQSYYLLLSLNALQTAKCFKEINFEQAIIASVR